MWSDGLIEITIRRNKNTNNAMEERLENLVYCFIICVIRNALTLEGYHNCSANVLWFYGLDLRLGKLSIINVIYLKKKT